MLRRSYLCIDLKSFYASVECIERHLDPMVTNLVVADISRTEKTICLAVSPALKAYGVPGRARLFEAVQKVKEANAQRQRRAPGRKLVGESCDANELAASPELAISYIVAPPRMALYMEYSTRIYDIYLRYISPDDIHVYSVDEVFIDITHYLKTYDLTSQELARKMIHEVYTETGITATAGLGTNLYLAKIAMDIVAKHAEPDENGVRMAELDEMSYRRQLWDHRPLTDFWRVGRGYSKKLEENGMFTMGDVAMRSTYDEDSLYGSAVAETARLTDKRIELDENMQAELSDTLNELLHDIDERPAVTITYFVPDKKKTGGAYVPFTGTIKKIDEYERVVVMEDGMRIPIEDIIEICRVHGE